MISQSKILADAKRLPTRPVSFARLTALGRDEGSSAEDFEEVLRTDTHAYVQFGSGHWLCFDLATDPTWRTTTEESGVVLPLAQQMLLWRNDWAAVRLLTEMLCSAQRPLARLHALCTLDGLDQLRPHVLAIALSDPHPGVVRHAIRLSEPLLGSNGPIEAVFNAMERLRYPTRNTASSSATATARLSAPIAPAIRLTATKAM